jgi:membrane fusion protein (multidrug efflux system)
MAESQRAGLDDMDIRPARARAPGLAGRRLVRGLLLLLGPAVLIVLAIHLYLAGGRFVHTDNAYVRADKVTISTDVSGVVADVPVRNDQRVEAGQVLVQLDDEPYRYLLAGAAAQLITVRSEIDALKANYRQKQEAIKRAETDVAFFAREYDRQKDLIQGRSTTQVRIDEALHNLESARQALAALREEMAAARANLEGAPNAAPESYARYAYVQALMDKAERDLRQAVIRAPAAGIVTNVNTLRPGAFLAAGQPAFSLVVADSVWIEANPKESDLTHVRAGHPATVVVDTYSDLTWPARVTSISPATGAEFALLPAQNASGNWVKVVQRVPVRLAIEIPADAPPLRAGMSATVEIDTGQRRTWSDLVRLIRRWIGS